MCYQYMSIWREMLEEMMKSLKSIQELEMIIDVTIKTTSLVLQNKL